MRDINVVKATYQSRKGDKQHHVALILNRIDGVALGIERLSLVNKGWGQMKTFRFNTKADGASWLAAKVQEITGQRYDQVSTIAKDVKSDAELSAAVGPGYWFKLGADAAFVAPGVDTKGITANDLPDIRPDASGRIRNHNAPRAPQKFAEYEPSAEEKAVLEAQRVADELHSNANWGEF